MVTSFADEKPEGELKTPEDKFSYMMGMDVGASLKRIGSDAGSEVNLAVFMQAVEAVLTGQETLLTAQEAAEIKQDFMNTRREAALAERKVVGEKNLAEGEAFQTENKAQEGVEVTDSGLQYQVIEQGDGPKPKATDKVTVHYRGTLVDGTEFDSSYQRGQPASFPLNGVIPGWTEGLQLMPVGSKYRFVVPPTLGYGEQGAGSSIGPNATLIFEVELLEIGE
jgi:FKBP-type peptidyl-prolyl cis-trans isomerase